MRNRAKCKKCDTILESMTLDDRVECACGNIEIWGGNQFLHCKAADFSNFLRIDDFDIEVSVKYVEKNEEFGDIPQNISRQDMIDMLDKQIKTIQQLPPNAMIEPANHYDLVSLMMLCLAIFKTLKD